MALADGFIDSICRKWGLPVLRQSTAIARLAPVTGHLPAVYEDYPLPAPHPFDSVWQTGSRLWIQVDCKAVADLCSGRAVLSKPELRPLFVRICRSLHSLYSNGLSPLHDNLDLVLWSPREYNAVADHCCNVAMDTQTSFQDVHTEPLACVALRKVPSALCGWRQTFRE